jgi:hypothetical protein
LETNTSLEIGLTVNVNMLCLNYSIKEAEEPKLLNKDFYKMLRFGIVDQSLLLLSLMAGVSLDALIARRIGVKV